MPQKNFGKEKKQRRPPAAEKLLVHLFQFETIKNDREVEALLKSASERKELFLGPGITDKGACRVLECCREQVQELSFKGSGITDKIWGHLQKCDKLKVLVCEDCKRIVGSGFGAIQDTKIEEIAFSHCSALQESELKCLFISAEVFRKVKTLEFAKCRQVSRRFADLVQARHPGWRVNYVFSNDFA